jgi:hypothetical protein
MLESIDIPREWSPNMSESRRSPLAPPDYLADLASSLSSSVLFDAGQVYPSASYYTQKLFSNTRGDTILPTTASTDVPKTFSYVASSTATQAIFKFANYADTPLSLTLSLDAKFGAVKSAKLMWSTTLDGSGDKLAVNEPKKEVRVGIQEAEIDVTGPVAVPAWTVGVIVIEV